MDWNWFFSSLAQSTAAIVGIFAAFLITKVVSSQGEFIRKKTRLKELLANSEKFRESFDIRAFDWYCERKSEYALEGLEDILNELEDPAAASTPAEYYDRLRFARYEPRDTVLERIEKAIADHRPPNRGGGRFAMLAPSIASMRFSTTIDNQTRQSVTEEGETIDELIVEAKQHCRLAKLHLTDITGDPEASGVVSLSILAAFLLFLGGVILPLSLLRLENTQTEMLGAIDWLASLLSLKGALLLLVTLIFSAILFLFWWVNSSLKYDTAEFGQLESDTKLENYSPYLQIRKENHIEMKKWYESRKAEQPDLQAGP